MSAWRGALIFNCRNAGKAKTAATITALTVVTIVAEATALITLTEAFLQILTAPDTARRITASVTCQCRSDRQSAVRGASNVRLRRFRFQPGERAQTGRHFRPVTQLRDKYPQLAYWISIAAAALDFIVKAFQKMPLRIVPTIVQSNDPQQASGFQNNYPSYSVGSLNSPNSNSPHQPVKITLYAESQPSEQNFVTAYPIVVQKWQANPDPEVISLYPPALVEPCLHVGVNVLKSTSLGDEPAADTFTRDFKLVMSSPNGFKKEFPLKKNQGLGGWELNLTREDLNAFPKIQMTLEAFITGTRGFSEIKSPPFNLPISLGGSFEVTPESKEKFAVGGKRRVALRNTIGNCLCLQAVVYKPSFGGQFVFEASSKDRNNQLQFSSDGREASFEVDAGHFQPGQGQLELKVFGGETQTIQLRLYPLPPNITDFKIAKGDNQALISGERLEQLQWVRINGKRAIAAGNNPGGNPNNPNQRTFVFEEPNARHTAGTVSLELGLEDNRVFSYPQTFTAGAARPTIDANEAGEIEGVFLENGTGKGELINKNSNKEFPFDLSKYPVVSIGAQEMSIAVRNKLTDYDFKGENLSIETRIEKSQPGSVESPKVAFEVLDANTLRLNFTFSEQSQKFIGGRRLQFRIRDRERGDSDWYAIKQTFVRIPGIQSVKCTNEMNGQCELKGEGIDYIQQVSIDGGQTWYPQEASGLMAQPTADGQKMAMIPLLINKKLLQIKLRDFPKTEGLTVTDFSFVNSVKAGSAKTDQKSND